MYIYTNVYIRIANLLASVSGWVGRGGCLGFYWSEARFGDTNLETVYHSGPPSYTKATTY
jgi:hypothetical protein